eukprot:m.134868 g.134868  ORF g.134868 m.134868 type:complete len:721 (-) comp15984_c0_seq1:46-2208(-)
MFSKVVNAFRSATSEFTEALNAAQRSPIEDLKQTWRDIADYVVHCEQEDDDTPADQTNLPTCFGAIVQVLQQEEEQHQGETGPCIEYILNHRILDQIVKLGLHNQPPGLLILTLAFFTEIFARIKQQLLPHVGVSAPVQALLQGTTAQLRDRPELNRPFMLLLCSVCGKLVDNPALGDLFVLHASSLHDPQMLASKPPTHLLVDAAAAVVTSADWHESRLAKDALLVCASLHSQLSQKVMLSHSLVWNILADHFVQLYVELPQQHSDTSPAFQAELARLSHDRMSAWRTLSKQVDLTTCGPDLVSLYTLVAWLGFLDEVASVNPSMGQALATALLERALRGVIGKKLIRVSEDVAYSTTTYLTICLTQIRCELLLRAFVVFLLGTPTSLTLSPDAPLDLLDAAGLELPETSLDVFADGDQPPMLYQPFKALDTQGAEGDASGAELRKQLIARCDDMSDRLSTASLLLILRLLTSYHELVYWQLLLGDVHAEPLTDEAAEARQAETSPARALVDGLMEVVPTHLKTDDSEESYSDYIVSAQAASQLGSQRCQRWVTQARQGLEPWVTAARSGDPGLNDTVAGGVAGVGPLAYRCSNAFISMLARKLKRFFHQPREMNLVLTAILTTLVQVPHVGLKESIMGSNETSVWAAVKTLQEDLAGRAGRDKDLEARVRSTRANMINEREVDDTAVGRVCQGVIFLEEFCKELAASLLVNANQVSLS